MTGPLSNTGRLIDPDEAHRDSQRLIGFMALVLGLPLIFLVLIAFTPLGEPIQSVIGVQPPDDPGLDVYSVTCTPLGETALMYVIFYTDSPAELQLESDAANTPLGVVQPGIQTIDIAVRGTDCPPTVTLYDSRNNRRSGEVVERLDE